MIRSQNMKYAVMVPCQAVASNATAQTNTVSYCDTIGYDQLTVVVQMGIAGGTNYSNAACKIQHADDTNATSFAEITGFVNGTDFTTPSVSYTAVTTLTNVYAIFDVPLQGKKRYFRTVLTPSTNGSQLVSVLGILSRAEQAPTNAAGVNAQIFVTPA